MAAVMTVIVLLATSADAQWLKYPTPSIPRTADGKPNLNAPAPRMADGKPDLQGTWANECVLDRGDGVGCTGQRGTRPTLFFDLARDLPADAVRMTAWAAAIQAQRVSRDHVDDPYGYCLPMGVPRMTVSTPFKILTTPGITALLHETITGLVFRQVFTDGRPLPPVTEPTWLGYSIGHWEDDVFVIESTGFRDGGWLDTNRGRPHSDALRLIERFRRVDFGHMELTLSIDDPKAYLKPWTVKTTLIAVTDTELIESFCDNQDKTVEHRRIDPRPPEPPSPPLTGSVR